MSPFLAWIGSPCLSHRVHGASIGCGASRSAAAPSHSATWRRAGGACCPACPPPRTDGRAAPGTTLEPVEPHGPFVSVEGGERFCRLSRGVGRAGRALTRVR
eukprot:COSAG01_NODE_3155_length_6492_cov_3.966995_7_plen_102_part_00